MPKLHPVFHRLLFEALEMYIAEIEESELTPGTQHIYIRHATTFVRWLNDDFSPGSELRRRREVSERLLELHLSIGADGEPSGSSDA